MIPSLVVDDLRSSLVEYLSSSFALADDDVRDALSQFLTDESDGIFRGPFLRVRTPFVAVDDEWTSPLDWLPDNFRPFDHQARAFERLSTNDHDAQPTLVTTGTGSGKTECFLMPLLDHCAREKAANRPGIKALILYPMNALASDQAGRIARLLAEDKKLKIVYRELPILGPQSLDAALASLAVAEQGNYGAFHRALYKAGRLTPQIIREAMQQAGVDMNRAKAAQNSAAVKEEIATNIELQRALQLTGTPSWVVGDTLLNGAVGYDQLKAAIAAARAKR